jgi:hypothetical protein
LAFPRPATAVNFVVVAMGVFGVAEIVRRIIAPILRGLARCWASDRAAAPC